MKLNIPGIDDWNTPESNRLKKMLLDAGGKIKEKLEYDFLLEDDFNKTINMNIKEEQEK